MRKIFLIVISVILAAGFVYFLINFSRLETAKAGSEHNLSGWAWSEAIGWISFNSKNCDANGDGRSDGSPVGCPPTGTSIANYGVNVASNGDMSGYAWSESIGWISFNAGDVSGCPSAPCAPTLNRTTGEVSGWARACAGTVNGDCTGASRTDGWDGWIHLRGANYGVSVSGCDWDGWAWGSNVVGWIHFKGSIYGVVGSGDACANRLPSAVNLSINQPNYCTSGPAAFFSWQFNDPDGDTQSAYQVQVDNNATFISPEDDSGKVFSSSQNYATPLGKLSYNTTYYWRVMVWDSKGAPSSWISGPSFTTPLHAYPNVDFSWIPLNPSVGETVQFTDQSSCFDSDNQCNSWAWTFQDGNPSSSPQQNATTTFNSAGPKTVTLKVTDSDGFNCQNSKTVNAKPPLPKWKEIAPF
jgi:hypothetical protein